MKLVVKVEVLQDDQSATFAEYDIPVGTYQVPKGEISKFIKTLSANTDGAADCYMNEKD